VFGRSFPVLQSETAECGLACIAMISQYHGGHHSLRSLRQRFPASTKGARLSDLISVAGKLGLSGRALRLELDDVPNLSTPCILHWNMTHFVVLVEVRRGKLRIADPAAGEVSLTLAEASDSFTGVALELSPTAKFEKRPPDPTVSIDQLTGPVEGLWKGLGLLLALSFALQVFTLVSPLYMQTVVDKAIVAADKDLLLILALGFGALVIFQSLTSCLRGWSIVYLSTRLSIKWVGNVFSHLVRLPLDYFSKRHVGDVVSRASAVQAIQQTVTTTAVEAVIDGVMAIATLAMMLLYSPALAVVTVLTALVYLSIRWMFFSPIRDRSERSLLASAKNQSHLLETIRGILTIKVSGKESVREASYQNLVVDAMNEQRAVSHLNLWFSTASQVLFGAERIVVVFLGASLVINGVFSVGALIAYLAYKDVFAARANGLVDKLVEFRMLRLHSERLADIVLTQPENDEVSDSAITSAPSDSTLEVEGLSFRYSESDPWVFRNCSIRIEPGQSVAIVGPSGSGKTTFAKVLMGLLPATEGVVRLGGVDIRRLGVGNYRQLIAAVMQEDQLFAGSISENIAFSFENDENVKSAVEEAAKLAAIHDDVLAMPMGYDSLIGDMGSSLSVGQKQRIVLARALFRKPQIAIFDEATSSLDVVSERVVIDSIKRLSITRVIIAHRPETIASADRVFALFSGALTEVPRAAV
jgi:ATP-binding cassette subfamily B protein RaxB